ncbi:MAG: hypothetical protein DRP30_00370 [Thermotoga sp.]|nr:MAG: hypothetical protein DRP30_00370 [Thermotoga sp.]
MLDKKRLTDQVYDYLKKMIIEFSLKPGEKIEIKKLSQDLSISPTPIREAIHKLIEQGLVVSKPYTGYFVVRLTPRDVEELFDLRKAFEFLGLEYVFQNFDSEKIEELSDRLKNLMKENDEQKLIDGVREFDEKFHIDFLIESSKNKWLMKLANGVIDLIRMTMHLTINPRTACKEHEEIIEAIKNMDRKKAKKLLDLHLERAKEDAIEYVKTQLG